MHFSGNKQGGDRYVIVRETKSFTGAQQYCRNRHTDLVSIRNPEEDQAVTKAVGPFNVLIGLFRDGWHWSDKRNSSFRRWQEDSFVGIFPQSCAVMTKQGPGRWSRRSCYDLHPFLCTCKKPLSVLE